MATNYIQEGRVIKLPVTIGKISGDHDLVGTLPVVCLTNRDSDGYAECAVEGVFDLSVTGEDGSGNSAVAVGDTLYYDSGTINKDATNGYEYGMALETVGSGETGTINVLLKKPCAPTPAADAVAMTDAGGYTAQTTVEDAIQEIYAHLLNAQNFIAIPLTTLLEGDGTNVVGTLDEATTPKLDMANGDTDSGLVLTWVASNSDPVLFQVPLPPDLDVASDLVVHLRAKSGGATDTPTISSDAYFNEGDTKVEDSSAAIGAAYAELTITIAADDIPSGAQTLTVELTPGAHTTDTVVMSAMWIEYTKQLLS